MKQISNKVKQIVQQLFNINDVDVNLTRPEPQFGDFSTNIAMQLSKQLGKNPREIAEQLISELKLAGEFEQVSIAGPGFINLKVKDSILTEELQKIITAPLEYGKSDIYQNKIVLTEFSDPNPFKVLHVGHLYTSVIGDAISNLIENAGGNVHRLNFGGDVGLHVAKTMWAMIRNFGGEKPEELSKYKGNELIEYVAKCYVEGTRAYEDDESAKAEITLLNKKVYQIHIDNDHESPFAQIYWECRQASYDHFNEFYNRIGVHFEKYYPESEIAALGLATVLEQKEKGVFIESKGAIVFEGEPYGLHTRVFVNKEGLPTYEAKDVGLSIKKWQDYHFDQSIIITANDIIEYMKVVLKSIEQFKPELSSRTRHITHGNVKLVGGVKMSSRMGNFLRATDVLEIVADANEATQGNRDEAPILGAIKYAFLKFKIGADSWFDPKESVSISGNSGPYLQYALARAKSIIKNRDSKDTDFNLLSGDYTKYERDLLLKITDYKDVIQQATIELTPHILCTYLYELAQTFNRFYENSRVIDDERENIRLYLVTAYVTSLLYTSPSPRDS